MSREIDQAGKLFAGFFDREPRDGEIAEIVRDTDTAIAIGKITAIMYNIEGEEKAFFHRFKKSDRPLLFVSSDGRQIYVLKGGYRFTQRGFIG